MCIKLSDELFEKDEPLAFTTDISGRLKFESREYLLWIEEKLADDLNVLKKGSLKGHKKAASSG